MTHSMFCEWAECPGDEQCEGIFCDQGCAAEGSPHPECALHGSPRMGSTAARPRGEGEGKLLPGTTAVGPSGLLWEYSGTDSDDHLPILGHEVGILQIAKALTPQGGTVIDVGAHVGLYALELAQAKGARVIAWEPNPATAAKLERNAARNGLSMQIEVIRFAAWHTDEVLALEDPTHGFETGGSTQVRAFREEDERKAVGAPLDRMLDWTTGHLDRVDLIKIDVEGAENNVLRGASQLITKFRPKLMIEVHDFIKGPENRTELESLLEQLAYTHGAEIPNGEGYELICQPKEKA